MVLVLPRISFRNWPHLYGKVQANIKGLACRKAIIPLLLGSAQSPLKADTYGERKLFTIPRVLIYVHVTVCLYACTNFRTHTSRLSWSKRGSIFIPVVSWSYTSCLPFKRKCYRSRKRSSISFLPDVKR